MDIQVREMQCLELLCEVRQKLPVTMKKIFGVYPYQP